MTGLKVNVAKSKMVPIGEVNNVHALAEILGVELGPCQCLILVCHWGRPINLPLFGTLY